MNTSPLLELLSHTALKGVAVLLVALLAGLSLRKVAAARRYAIWITAVAALAILPLAMSLLPAWRVLPQTTVAMDEPVFEPEMPDENPAPILLPVGAKISLPASAFETQAPAPVKTRPAFSWQDAVDALPVVWITLAALLLLRLGWSAWRLHRLERSLQPGTCAALDETAREVGLKRVPRLLIGAANAVPMVWGVWRPRLLLPAGFESWTAGKLRGVLLHELAHLKRGDPLALWLAQWVKALHWFNPLAWLTIRQLRADQERACDDAVLRHGVRASDYAQHLLDLSRHTRIAPGLALCALTITRCAPVEARVKAILDPKRHREALTPRWLLGLAGFALLTTLPVAMLHAIEGAKLRGRILDRNGVVLAESTQEKVRVYPLKTLAAHVIGYTGKTAPKDPTPTGRAGFEKLHNEMLRVGKDISSSLDARIQSLTIQAMSEGGVTRGAAVVLDPRTGEILASVSLPSYDPNVFVPSISKEAWESYAQNKDLPLLHRSAAEYSPGSTYKMFIGLAGIAAGVGDRKFNCEGSVTYGNAVMQCWIKRADGGRHGELSLAGALAASCNCFFYQFGNAAGIEQIEGMGRKIGFGTRYGITNDEGAGILPNPSWLQEHRPMEKWSAAHTANASIGQGMVLVTPLQLTVLAATVGNGGKVPEPSLLKKEHGTTWRADLITDGLPAAQIEQLREGMRLVVHGESGTGKAARSDKVVIAGKTGTSQFFRQVDGQRVLDNRAWFIGFAPFEKPTLAFAILKEGGKSGGGDCAPIAKRIVEETLALHADGTGEVKPVGDTAGGAWEKAEAQRSAFDAKAAAISSAIQRAKPDAKTDFVLSELKIGHGEVTLHGTASGLIQALEFRAKLVKIGDQFEIQWASPVPKTMQDGKRVEFQARGIYQPANSGVKKTEPAPKPASKAEIRQQSDAAIRMRATDADNWKFLRSKGLLADLPAEAVVPVLSERDKQHSSSVFQFRFSAPRVAVRRWLLESLRVKAGQEETFLNWPEPPETFNRTYSAVDGCQIMAQCPDGETVYVRISKQKPRILIAPDEATPPTPKTAAPKELEGVVSIDSQWPAHPVVWMNPPFPLHLHVEDTYPEEQDELKAALAQRDSINNRFNKALLTRQSAR